MFTAHGAFFYVPLLAPMVGAFTGGSLFKAFIDLSDGIDNEDEASNLASGIERRHSMIDAAAPVIKDDELELGVPGRGRADGKTGRFGNRKLGRSHETIANLAIEEGSLRRERSIQNLVVGACKVAK